MSLSSQIIITIMFHHVKNYSIIKYGITIPTQNIHTKNNFAAKIKRHQKNTVLINDSYNRERERLEQRNVFLEKCLDHYKSLDCRLQENKEALKRVQIRNALTQEMLNIHRKQSMSRVSEGARVGANVSANASAYPAQKILSREHEREHEREHDMSVGMNCCDDTFYIFFGIVAMTVFGTAWIFVNKY